MSGVKKQLKGSFVTPSNFGRGPSPGRGRHGNKQLNWENAMDALRESTVYDDNPTLTDFAYMKKQVQELKDRLRFSERQMGTITSQRDGALKHAEELKAKVLELQGERAEHEARKDALLEQHENALLQQRAVIASLESRIHGLDEDVEAARAATTAARTQESEQKMKLRQHTEYERSLELSVSATRDSEATLRSQLEAHMLLVKDMSAELLRTKQEMSEASRQNAEYHLKQADYDRLQTDNARLQTLLLRMGAPVYGSLVQELGDTEGGLAYVPPPAESSQLMTVASRPAQKHLQQLPMRAYPRQADVRGGPPNPSSEAGDWLPLAVFNLAATFRTHYIPDTPLDVILEFVAAMNKVWRKRERQKMDAFKTRYRARVAAMKRTINGRVPYNTVLMRQEVQRLMAELARIPRQRLPESYKVPESQTERALHAALGELDSLRSQVNKYSMDYMRKQEDGVGVAGGLRSVGAPLIAYIGRVTCDLVDSAIHQVGDISEEYRHKALQLPRHDVDFYRRLSKTYSTLTKKVQDRLKYCRTQVRQVAEQAVDQAINLHFDATESTVPIQYSDTRGAMGAIAAPSGSTAVPAYHTLGAHSHRHQPAAAYQPGSTSFSPPYDSHSQPGRHGEALVDNLLLSSDDDTDI